MKEQIKIILQEYFDVEDSEFIDGHVHINFDDLATILYNVMRIDEEKINSELLSRSEWFYKFQEGSASGGWLRHKIAKSIKELRPLKVTVENE